MWSMGSSSFLGMASKSQFDLMTQLCMGPITGGSRGNANPTMRSIANTGGVTLSLLRSLNSIAVYSVHTSALVG